jgi:hypothetical protein
LRQAKEPQRGEPHEGKGTINVKNLHQSHEAHQLKTREVKPNKTPSLEKPFLTLIAHLEMEAAYALCNITYTLL